MSEVVSLNVNGETRDVVVKPGLTLMHVLRDQLGLVGAKPGCVTGNCGACKVLVDGKAVVSCTMGPKAVAGKKIVTIEGLAKDGKLDPLQQSFIDHNALQCGYCIPGMIISAKALMLSNPRPTEQQIGQALRGNICRCGCYIEIKEAIQEVARDEGGR